MKPDQILKLFADTAPDPDWSFRGYTPKDTSKWTHGYHRYPAKFIPQLVEKLLDTYTYESGHLLVHDPFMGSGTTLVSAVARQHIASGTDINHISYYITKAKCQALEPRYLEAKVQDFNERVGTLMPDSPRYALVPHNAEKIEKWYDRSTKEILQAILNLILDENSAKLKLFLLVGFSHILKNCSYWRQNSTKPLRDLDKKTPYPQEALERHLKKMVKGNNEFYEHTERRIIPPRIEIGSAKSPKLTENSVDIIITSSPYVTSYEYADLHQLSMLWLNFVDDIEAHKKEFIGTSKRKDPNATLRSEIAKSIVAEMAEKSKSKALEIQTFYADMQEVFDNNAHILKTGRRACYVIGNTRLKGVDILNAEVYAESMQHSGFHIEKIIKREIPSKILPQERDEKTGRFKSGGGAQAYPTEYIVIGQKK